MKVRTLKRSWQFRTCYSRGRKVVCDYAVVFYHETTGEGLQFGVVASKRVGNAVKRNRAKRLLREAARGVAGELNDPNLWVVLVARSTITTHSSREVHGDIKRALTSAGLLTRGT